MREFINGLNVLVVNDLEEVNQDSLQRCLILEVDDNGKPASLYYSDALGNIELDHESFNLVTLLQLAQDKEVDLNSSAAALVYLQPEEISSVLADQIQAIPTEKEMVKNYFRKNPDVNKLSRKNSGLQNSYIRGSGEDIISLDNKDECRVVWQDSPPTRNIFNNLPANTSAVYVVVQNTLTKKHDVFYIANQADSEPVKVASLRNPAVFSKYRLSNTALSQQELENIAIKVNHRHKNKVQNVLGRGGFGRVKAAQSIVDNSPKATKTQELPSYTKYVDLINDLRSDPSLSKKFEDRFIDETFADSNISETSSTGSEDFEIDSAVTSEVKAKPEEGTSKSRGFLKGLFDKVTGKRNRSISPVTDVESELDDSAPRVDDSDADSSINTDDDHGPLM